MNNTDIDTAKRIQNECMSYDPEADHVNADDILCELLLSLGYVETVKAYNAVEKWYV